MIDLSNKRDLETISREWVSDLEIFLRKFLMEQVVHGC